MFGTLSKYVLALSLLISFGDASIGWAQSESKMVHTLVIENGKVWVNNKQVSQVPDNLNLSGLSLESHFIGVNQPLINLNSQVFRVSEQGLHPFSYASASRQELMGQYPSDGNEVILGPVEENNLRAQYLQKLENTNQLLFRWLTEESRLDVQSRQLAYKIQQTSNAEEKQQMMEELYEMLNSIFILKQKNRMAEISHLELQLEDLRSRFEKRESMRQFLIEKRVKELLVAY